MSEVRFGAYRTTDVLGSGPSSTIYRAVQEPLGRVVAIKTLKPSISPTSSFGEQLEREAAILTDFAHPNVVLLIELGRADGRPYLVLEHVDGPSLQQLLAKRRKLGIDAALAVACGICAGLAHVHEHGVVHRDLSPSNVLFTKAGIVKLADFGIAQRARTVSVSDAFGTEGITPSGRIVPDVKKEMFGTPAYMSPEQILGDFVDARSDLFSLGVVLYQMLSGTRPFEAPSHSVHPPRAATKGASPPLARASRPPPSLEARDSAQRIRRDTPPPLRSRAPEVPRAVERIVMRLLEKAPDDRFASGTVVTEQLSAALRSRTREDPTLIVRSTLAEAGLVRGERFVKFEGAELRPRVPMGRAMLGFVGLGAVFSLGALAIQLSAPSAAAEGTHAGSDSLPLVPDRAGGLRVVASPWAHVSVDGERVETTPFARPIPLSEGRHFVTLSHPDAPDVRRDVDVVEGQIVTLEITMALPEEAGAAPAGDEPRAADDEGERR